jgi:UDP-GlcNAc3NAcA epimerase
MRILTVIGNRPQFIKAAAVSHRLRVHSDEILVHTGQHHDDELSAVFVAELDVPPPEIELGVHSGSNASQTARMLAALEPVVADAAPDLVLVYGDTNSTLAGGSSQRRRVSPSRTSRPGWARSTGRCPRR